MQIVLEKDDVIEIVIKNNNGVPSEIVIIRSTKHSAEVFTRHVASRVEFPLTVYGQKPCTCGEHV